MFQLLRSHHICDIQAFTNQTLCHSYPPGFFLQFLYRPHTLCLFVPDETGKVIAVISGELDRTGYGHVFTLAVAPDHRRSGLGRSLLTEFASQMLQMDSLCRGIRLEVLPNNNRAIAFYSSQGFQLYQKLSNGMLSMGRQLELPPDMTLVSEMVPALAKEPGLEAVLS